MRDVQPAIIINQSKRMRSEIVPTRLSVEIINNITGATHTLNYKKLEDDELAYQFEVYPIEGAEEALEEVVSAMESQSYDHGQCWRRTLVEKIDPGERYMTDMYSYFKVGFRIRDSY